jgi:hypothetical protein
MIHAAYRTSPWQLQASLRARGEKTVALGYRGDLGQRFCHALNPVSGADRPGRSGRRFTYTRASRVYADLRTAAGSPPEKNGQLKTSKSSSGQPRSRGVALHDFLHPQPDSNRISPSYAACRDPGPGSPLLPQERHRRSRTLQSATHAHMLQDGRTDRDYHQRIDRASQRTARS